MNDTLPFSTTTVVRTSVEFGGTEVDFELTTSGFRRFAPTKCHAAYKGGDLLVYFGRPEETNLALAKS